MWSVSGTKNIAEGHKQQLKSQLCVNLQNNLWKLNACRGSRQTETIYLVFVSNLEGMIDKYQRTCKVYSSTRIMIHQSGLFLCCGLLFCDLEDTLYRHWEMKQHCNSEILEDTEDGIWTEIWMQIKVDRIEFENVRHFTYLGSNVMYDLDCGKEVKKGSDCFLELDCNRWYVLEELRQQVWRFLR